MRTLALIIFILAGCQTYDADCLPVIAHTESCGATCIPTEMQAQLIDKFIEIFSERHGHGAEVEKALYSLRITWVDCYTYWSERAHREVTGETFGLSAIKIACKGHILGWTALSWECMNVSLWTIYGHPCEGEKEWTPAHTDTIGIVDREFI